MDKRSVYLDHQTTTPVLEEALQAMLPYFREAIKSEKLENLIKLRDPVVAALQDLGLNKAADAVQNLTMPEKGKEFDLTGLGITKPAPEMSGMEAVDAALSSGLEEKLTKIGLTPPSRRAWRKNWRRSV